MPGPGHYQIGSKKLNGFSVSFGSAQRPKPINSDIPGPGNYKIQSSLGNMPKYAISQKKI